MHIRRKTVLLLLLVLLCLCQQACGAHREPEPTEPSVQTATEPSAIPTETRSDLPVRSPVDIETVGGAVIVGTVCRDEQGWYLQPEQPLNIAYQYFLDAPSLFREQTRINLFDPGEDGMEKALYLGQTVTAAGTFRFYRDDFETLYFMPYTITLGRHASQSHSAPDLTPPEPPENLYDPSQPLPEQMALTTRDGQYVFNPFLLSEEALAYLGNGFAEFYAEFVAAFLNYETEVFCPDRNYAEMLSTVIYYELPLYNACAEPFEYFRHYDPEKACVSIVYRQNREAFEDIKARFFTAADGFLSGTSPDRTDGENARSIYHALCTAMTYDDSALTEFERKESYYAYLYNSGVCLTFANAYNQLLTQVGIRTTLAHCDSEDTVGHSWSVITLDGVQYFCDPTYELSYDSGAGFRFFGMSYADRTADGTGTLGIRYGRYRFRPLDPAMIGETSLGN